MRAVDDVAGFSWKVKSCRWPHLIARLPIERSWQAMKRTAKSALKTMFNYYHYVFAAATLERGASSKEFLARQLALRALRSYPFLVNVPLGSTCAKPAMLVTPSGSGSPCQNPASPSFGPLWYLAFNLEHTAITNYFLACNSSQHSP